MSEKKSPEKYKTSRAVPKIEEFEKFKRDNEPIRQIGIMELQTMIDIDENFNRLSIPRDENIVNINKHNNFLCELELFNWTKIQNSAIIGRIKQSNANQAYIGQLCRQLGNDLNLFTEFISSQESTTQLADNIIQKYISKDDNIILIDIPASILFMRTKDRNIFRLTPIFLFNRQNTSRYICYYSPQILNSNNKRYSIIMFNYFMKTEGHFTFIFVDHQNRTVDHYDPNGAFMTKTITTLVYNFLSRIFKGYTINEFWTNVGIQNTEGIEQDEEGFCVVWGTMMMHLKLLNINTPMKELEKLFIEYCGNKNLSLYEVMINYAYHMNRIIPRGFSP